MNNEVLKHITFSFICFNVGICNKYVSNANGRTTPIQEPFFALLTNQKMVWYTQTPQSIIHF